ncbi:SGNH hydrolase domain-containing protein [Aeromonas media]|uniref:SGNH hydrolase domain-containing protein n=1 Tax=Aeromonas media TaxID=651 RepID=UPI0038D191D3
MSVRAALELSYSGCPTVLGAKCIKSEFECSEFASAAIDMLNKKHLSEKIIYINRSSSAILGANIKTGPAGVPTIYFSEMSYKPNKLLNQQFTENFVKTICSINTPSRVYLVRPIPEMGIDVPKTMSRALMFGKPVPQISISLEEYHQRHAVVLAAQDEAASQCGVKIINPLPYLCHDGRCWGSKDGRPFYYDDNHLSEFGNKLLVPMFKQVWAES